MVLDGAFFLWNLSGSSHFQRMGTPVVEGTGEECDDSREAEDNTYTRRGNAYLKHHVLG
ncbi:MAG: hypothetical protein QG656_1383 [Candidatus Hydrogenedentes bacterium]|nr:hypothetical protein [Candidatus Hydrogenedentota bacterium]